MTVRTSNVTTVTADLAPLHAAHATAAAFYRSAMLDPATARPRNYLARRNLARCLTPTSPWQVGYAGSSWTALTDHLRQAGHTDEQILTAGLALRARTGRLIDRFRDRIMIPLRDDARRTIAFIGRAAPGAAGNVPRYLNSPETPLYRKGHHLFGLHEQVERLHAGDTPAIVEGPFDVLAIAGTGAPIVAVTPCGTALTANHVDALHQHSPHRRGVLVATDNDPAGIAAAVRAYQLLDGHFGTREALTMPAGADPAGLGQNNGLPALRRHLTDPANRRPLLDLVVDAYLQQNGQGVFLEHRVAAMRGAARLLADTDAPDAARQVVRLATALDLAPYTVTEAIADAIADHRRR